MIILGIDPGTATTGYGIIEDQDRNNLKCLGYGCIITEPLLSPAERLKELHNQLNKVIKKYEPKILAVESLFFFKNLKTALPVSQAKGVILLTGAKKNMPIFEFTPLQVKMTTVGYGRATKHQIQKMIQLRLKLEKIPKPDDAADALAVAICYINSAKILNKCVKLKNP